VAERSSRSAHWLVDKFRVQAARTFLCLRRADGLVQKFNGRTQRWSRRASGSIAFYGNDHPPARATIRPFAAFSFGASTDALNLSKAIVTVLLTGRHMIETSRKTTETDYWAD